MSPAYPLGAPRVKQMNRTFHWRHLLIGRHPRRTLVRAAVLAVLVFVVGRFVLRPALTQGISMEPTVADRSLHLLNLVAYRTGDPQWGDIVAVRTHGEHLYYLKRVIGVPGEAIAFAEGVLLRDTQVVPESYVQRVGHWNMDAVLLGPEEYFVAGDNRSTSMRDHVMGVVDQEHIRGKLLW